MSHIISFFSGLLFFGIFSNMPCHVFVEVCCGKSLLTHLYSKVKITARTTEGGSFVNNFAYPHLIIIWNEERKKVSWLFDTSTYRHCRCSFENVIRTRGQALKYCIQVMWWVWKWGIRDLYNLHRKKKKQNASYIYIRI